MSTTEQKLREALELAQQIERHYWHSQTRARAERMVYLLKEALSLPEQQAPQGCEALRLALECVRQSTEYRIGNPAYEQCETAIVDALSLSVQQAPQGADFRKCEFCGCNTNAKARACCEKGRAADLSATQSAEIAAPKAENEELWRYVLGR